jgi:hypothetical protein
LSEAQAALAAADPEPMAPLAEGYRDHILGSTDGGVAPRWALISSAHRRPQAQRTIAQQRRRQSAAEVNAFKPLSRTAFACEADAPQALATLTPGLQATSLHEVTRRPLRRYPARGRPGKATGPAAQADHIAGALTPSLAARQARVAQHRCVILAANERDEGALSPQALLAGYKGHKHAERGCRFLNAPRFLAPSLSLKTPPRIMALLMVRTVCLLVDAAWEDRIRATLRADEATLPDHTGQPPQTPTARWVFPYVGGLHLLRIPGEGPLVLNLTDPHEHLLQRLGAPDQAFYS